AGDVFALGGLHVHRHLPPRSVYHGAVPPPAGSAQPLCALKSGAQRIVDAPRLERGAGGGCPWELEQADLPAKTVAALRLVDLLSAPHPMIDTATYQRLRAHLDDRELLELGAALSVASGWQRFIEAFGIRPDSWTEAMPLPWHME